jgi:hypothetical protein
MAPMTKATTAGGVSISQMRSPPLSLWTLLEAFLFSFFFQKATTNTGFDLTTHNSAGRYDTTRPGSLLLVKGQSHFFSSPTIPHFKMLFKSEIEINYFFHTMRI